ncbi:hypothetical protein VP01_3190g3, partial [Puccinia sorghi]
PTRHPTPEEITGACQTVDSTFFLLHSGRCVITDPKDRKSIIAVIEFTPWEQLTEKDKDDLNFLSTFLHGSKEFVNPVASSRRSWGGKMWAIGNANSSNCAPYSQKILNWQLWLRTRIIGDWQEHSLTQLICHYLDKITQAEARHHKTKAVNDQVYGCSKSKFYSKTMNNVPAIFCQIATASFEPVKLGCWQRNDSRQMPPKRQLRLGFWIQMLTPMTPQTMKIKWIWMLLNYSCDRSTKNILVMCYTTNTYLSTSPPRTKKIILITNYAACTAWVKDLVRTFIQNISLC